MVFSNLIFLYLFLPACLIAYFCVKGLRAKNMVLLLFSLLFYAWGEPVYVLLMMGSAALNYAMGLAMGRLEEGAQKTKYKKLLLMGAVAVNLLVLGIFKYAGLFISTFNQLTGLALPVPEIALPIGISFFTFQAMTYVIDVYRGQVKVQQSYGKFLLYISMFPQLIAGPIVRYADIEAQLEERSSSREDIFYGLVRFSTGLGKKILLADHAYTVCSKLLDGTLSSATVVGTWLGVIMFAFQIYFDFSGYSDMAIGLGRMFGFDFPENFNYPYISKSITEFWRRWHMTLGGWFREYVYIPLGGNRVSTGRWVLNLFAVWGLTGLWHGAAWNFVIWGLYHGTLLLLEKLALSKILSKAPAFVSHVYVLLLVTVSMVIFNAADMGQALQYIGGMFGLGGVNLMSQLTGYYLRSYGLLFIFAFIGATPVVKLAAEKVQNRVNAKVMDFAEPLVLAGLLILVTAYLVDGSFNPFLYFRF